MEAFDDPHAHIYIKPANRKAVYPQNSPKHDLAGLDSSKESDSCMAPVPADSQLTNPHNNYSTRWNLPGHQQSVNSWDAAALHKSSQPAACPARHPAQHAAPKRRPTSLSVGLSSGHGCFSGAAAAPSAASFGTHLSAAAYGSGELCAPAQPSASEYSCGFSTQSGMMSPAAFVHNAQQMLLQQQQQMQQLQQQQVLLSLQQQQRCSPMLQQKQQQPQHTHSSVAAAATAIASLAASGCTRQQQQQAEIRTATSRMRAALGDKTFYSIRSLLLKQQEAFVQQMFELHRVVRVQQVACLEVTDPLHQLTEQYSNQALARMQTSMVQKNLSNAQPSASVATTAAAAENAAAAADQQVSSSLRQRHHMSAGARPVSTDDRGAAAAADLSIHTRLMLNLPSTMRAAVAAAAAAANGRTRSPRYVDAAKYYVPEDCGLLRPVAAAGCIKSPWEKGSNGTTAAAAAKGEAGRYGQCDEKQQQQRGCGVSAKLSQLVPDVATSAAAAAVVQNMQHSARQPAGSVGSNRVCDQQQQMPPPRRMLPEQAAQHAAAAAAQHQQRQQQQQPQASAAAAARMTNISTARRSSSASTSTSSGLNVFRPQPQIDLSFATKFLAGGDQRSTMSTQSQPSFDPHSYWMKKHYGETAAAATGNGSQQQQQSSGVGSRSQQQSVSAGAAMSSGRGCDPAAAAAAPESVPQWLQDPAATLGGVGAMDVAGCGTAAAAAACESEAQSFVRSSPSTGKRTPPQYRPEDLPPKKRAKLAGNNAAAAGYGGGQQQLYNNSYGWSSGAPYAQQEYSSDAAAAAGFAGIGAQIDCGVYEVSKERSCVRSNRLGSSRQCESHCSDNSTSDMDNPALNAAAGAAAAAAEVDGISLLLQLGQQATLAASKALNTTGVPVEAFAASNGVSAGYGVAQGAKGPGSTTSGGVGSGSSKGQLGARSAAALLLSLSGSVG